MNRLFFKNFESLSPQQKFSLIIRSILSFFVFVFACAGMFWLRSRMMGEDGSSLATYFLGTLFILLANLAIWAGKLANPEKTALSFCIAAVIFTGTWVNLEEKLVLPILAATCEESCVLEYERQIPFSGAALVYRSEWGWRVKD